MNYQQLFGPHAAQVDQLMAGFPPQYIEAPILPALRRKLALTSRDLAITHDISLPNEFILRKVVAFPELVQQLKACANKAMMQVNWQGINALPDTFNPPLIQQDTLKPEKTIREHFAQVVRPALAVANLLINRNLGAPLLEWNPDGPIRGGNFSFLQSPKPGESDPSWSANIQSFRSQLAPLQYTQPLLVYEFKTPAFACHDVQRVIGAISGTGLPYQWYCYDANIEAATMSRTRRNPENQPTMGAGPDSRPPVLDFIAQHATEVLEVPPYRMIETGIPGSRIVQSAEERARITIQHAWKQSVIRDTTFLVINMGNKEIIGYRDRATRTLFLSDPVTLHNPDYNRIPTGLFVTTFWDFVKRMSCLRRALFLDMTTLETQEEQFRVQQIRDNFHNPPQMMTRPDPQHMAIQGCLEGLPYANYLAIIPSIRAQIADPRFLMKGSATWSKNHNEQDWLFICQMALGNGYMQWNGLLSSVPRADWPNNNRRRLTLVASSAWSRFQWSAELKQGISTLFSGLAAIIAVGPAEVRDLREEYSGYLLLRKAGADPSVLPNYYTLIESPEEGLGGAAILVAELPGECITKQGLGPLHQDFGKRFGRVLGAIHRCGYLHGSLKADSLYIQPNGASVYILDFSKVTKVAEGDAGRQQFKDEMVQLNTILGQYIPGLVIAAPNLAGPPAVQAQA
ncbi:hypothetical protein BDN72DRAFT_960744 [Pluteus cervinus]|uniref:Uncharacterized protein n=1 Tax=Pluteus cervinus TaxID=181527 RepID=A0ACD3AP90_9AGAR|nr:hypothetical protein BDN72DRAFT_960744 [Pluteus cervinus]